MVFVSHSLNSTMKTVILLCSLASFATAIPTLIKGTFNEHEPTLQGPSATITREKKSPLHDSIHEDIKNHEKEILPTNIGLKSQIVAPAFEGRSSGFKKPLIIKKKFGYHLYRDSDEEMTYADPRESCRKQVKVKLCDDDPSSNTNKLSKSTKSAQFDISEKEVEHSIKMAKEAVETLQRNIQKMEESSMKLRENSKYENLATDTEVQEDIETARKALEHITQNFETLESMESPRMNEDILTQKSIDEERLAQWKDAIENIHKNFEIAKNIEDTFKFESLNSFSAENGVTKLTDHISTAGEHEVQEKSNNEFFDDSNSELKRDKNVSDEEKLESLPDSPIGKASSLEEKRVENDDDMFTSTSNDKEFNIELHSDSLKQEKTATDLVDDNIEKEALLSDETRMSNVEEKLLESKNAQDVTDDQFPMLNEPYTQHIIGKSSFLEKQASAETENKEIPNLAKEADVENINLSEKDDHKSMTKSSEVTSDSQTQEEIKELLNIVNSNYENIEELFMPKEATDTGKTLTELTSTNIPSMHEKSADEQQNEEKLLSLPVIRESDDEIKMRESLDISTLPKESFDDKNHMSDTSAEKMPSDNLLRNGNTDSSQRMTSEDTDETFHLHSVQEKHAIVEPATLITPINFSKQHITNDHLSTSLKEHDTLGRTITQDLDPQGTNMLRSVHNLDKDDAIINPVNIHKEHLHAKINQDQNNINTNDDLHTLRYAQENEYETKDHNLKSQQNVLNEETNMRMAEDQTKAQSLLKNQELYDSHNFDLTHLIQDSDYMNPKFKTVVTDLHKESLLPTLNNPSDQHVSASNELLSIITTGDLGMEREATKNDDIHVMSKPLLRPTLFPIKDLSDESKSQEFRSTNFNNDKNSLTTPINNGLDTNQMLFNGKQVVRMNEDSNMEEYLNQNRNLQMAPISRWSEDSQRMDDSLPGFKSATNLQSGNPLLAPSNGVGRYDEDQMAKEQPNMRMNEARYTGQQYNYNNNHQLHDMQSMAYVEDKQNKHMSQLYNHVPEFHNNNYRPHLQQHGHGHMNKFNQFELDNNHDMSLLPSRNHDHMHLMRDHKMSELDSSMQPSNQMNMRDNGLQWGHHHGMSRNVFATGLPVAGVSPGAVGVFPTASTGCGIPLMLSCSPSVVSGTLAKTHPSIPAYRSDYDTMYYMKRDAKNIDETPVKIQRTPLKHKSELILNKQ